MYRDAGELHPSETKQAPSPRNGNGNVKERVRVRIHVDAGKDVRFDSRGSVVGIIVRSPWAAQARHVICIVLYGARFREILDVTSGKAPLRHNSTQYLTSNT